MKSRIGWAVVLLVLIAPSSEAGLFKRGAKYTPPKAASPLNQGADETQKFTGKGHKPEKYQRPDWGNVYKQSLRLKGSPTIGHYNEF